MEAFEHVLAQVIEAYGRSGPSALNEACERHPEWASRLRARLEHLHRLGLLEDEREPGLPAAFGPYRVLRRIGQGGMSAVYLAVDERIGRRVALKRCHESLGGDDRIRRRFEQEIRAVAQLDHPGIVDLYDVGEQDGQPYFVMEYVRGATLSQLLEQLRLSGLSFEEVAGSDVRRLVHELDDAAVEPGSQQAPSTGDERWGSTYVETVCRFVLDVADALDHAHRNGIVHRDVKPSNVLIRRDGRAQLFDLGLARLEDQPALTRSGDFTGTPYYVSPEQLAGRPAALDGRTDVYSLGVTLYELLAWRRPFEGDTTAAVFRQIEDSEPPSLQRLNPAVPADLETICATAMEKGVAARYQSAGALAEDLRRFLAFRPVAAQPVGAARRAWRVARRRPAVAVAALLALLVLLGLPAGLFLANRLIAAEAREATRQAERNRTVTEYLVQLFRLSPTELARADRVTAREILDRGAARLPTGFEGQPLVRAALMRATGRVYRNLGLYDEALPLLDRSFAIVQRELGEDHVDAADTLHDLADVHGRAGRAEDSLALGRRSLAALRRSGREREPVAIRCRVTLARALMASDDVPGAGAMLDDALQLSKQIGLGKSEQAAIILEERGRLATSDADTDGALSWLGSALAIRRSLRVPDAVDLARTLEQLGSLHAAAGNADEAERRRAEAERLRAQAARAAGPSPRNPFTLRPAWAEQYDVRFQEGITALQSGRYDHATAAFEECLGWRPGHAICSYNAACARALAGDLMGGLAWMQRAVDDGFGHITGGIAATHDDPDLDALRGRPEWSDLVRRMEATAAEVGRYTVRPGWSVPPGTAPADGWPVLVVLHGNGATREQVLAGPWRHVADTLGLALLAPSAPAPTHSHPADGMDWFDVSSDFLAEPWESTEPVIDVVRASCASAQVDGRRIYLAGEGYGALVAADMAFSAPGFFAGLVVHDGPIAPELAPERTALAAAVGLPVRVLLGDAQSPGHPGGSSEVLRESVAAWLSDWGLTDSEVHAPVAPEDVTRQLVDVVGRMLHGTARRP